MKKRNVTDNELVGWLIFRPDTEEFVYVQRMLGVSVRFTGYVKEPSFAFVYGSEESAFEASKFIQVQTNIVPLFDLGDELAVGFEK